MFYGRGAGKLPTASAVVADMLDCARHEGEKRHPIRWKTSETPFIKQPGESKARMLVRTAASAEDVLEAFPDAEMIAPLCEQETAFLTPTESERELAEKLERIGDVKTALRLMPYHG